MGNCLMLVRDVTTYSDFQQDGLYDFVGEKSLRNLLADVPKKGQYGGLVNYCSNVNSNLPFWRLK